MIDKNDMTETAVTEAAMVETAVIETTMVETDVTKNDTVENICHEETKSDEYFGYFGYDLYAKRTCKDTIFRIIFKEKENLLSLYNAINGTNYTNVDEFTIVTLENAIYMSMKNDLAFVVDFQMYLYEHQSTYNPNIPLRNLFYISLEYRKLIDENRLYSRSMIKLPTPQFMVFYNGEEKRPEREVFRLSDMFAKPTDTPNLELKVQVLNINAGNNEDILEACRMLKDYSLFVERVRSYRKIYSNYAETVDRAVTDCIKEGILAEFLKKNRAEVLQMCLFEYDEKAVMEVLKQDSYEDGLAEGFTKGEQNKLSNQVSKKLAKGKTLEEIANDLEEDIEVIRDILAGMDKK